MDYNWIFPVVAWSFAAIATIFAAYQRGRRVGVEEAIEAWGCTGRVGKKGMVELRRRLSRGGQPSDGILLRRDLVEALVAEVEATPKHTKGMS